MGKHIDWLGAEEKELEKNIWAEYSRDNVEKHLNYLTTLTRIAGTEDELKAANYFKETLNTYGIDAKIHEFDAYISQPGEAALDILSPIQKSIPCLAEVFIASTAPEGMEADLVSVGPGFQQDYQGLDVTGKIVLIGPVQKSDHVVLAQIAEKMGAAAQIHINSGKPEAIAIAQLRNTWGSPTLETIDKIPKIPAIAIGNADGLYLQKLADKGPVRVRLKANASRGYKTVRLPEGTLRGMQEPEKFVLFATHYCSWFQGATDNAVGNSLLLEIARIFSKHREGLVRSIRFTWWPGHSQGTFAGSTWYLDNFWEDIRDNAIAYMNMDGLGRMGSSVFEAKNTEDVRAFYEGVIKDVLNLKVQSKKLTKSGDQSFWGMGLPTTVGSLGFTAEQTAAMGGKPVWYSHTVDDTLDKVDLEIITSVFKVNSAALLRLCNNPVLPFDFTLVAQTAKQRLRELQEAGRTFLDLGPLIAQAEALAKNVADLNRGIAGILAASGQKGTKGSEKKLKAINTCLTRLSRILISALYSKAGKYGQDPMGSKFKRFPTLQPLEEIDALDGKSEHYRALRTSMLRERNKLSDDLALANSILVNTIEIMAQP